jgi:ribonuclease P protein component
MDFKKNYVSVKKSRDFKILFKKGNSFVTYGFVCYYFESKHGKNRLGLVASKKVGNAVKRNRAKRVIREAFRIAQPKLREKTDKHYDFIFVARGKTPYLKSSKIYELMEKLFVKL